MAFENDDTPKLEKTVKGLKMITIALAICWTILIAFMGGIELYALETGRPITIFFVFFLIGSISVIVLFLFYRSAKKELAKRKV